MSPGFNRSATPSVSGGAGGGFDPDDANPDTDGDRFSDGYEAAVLGVAACADGDVAPQLADVNLDAAVSNADALAVLHLFIRKIGPEDGVFQGTGFRYADPSRDGQISNMDALVIQAFFLGLLARLPLH